MAESQEREIQPPYLSFSTVKNFVAFLRATGLPNRIDRSLIVGQSGATQSYLLSAMKFFGLMDATGKPTERLNRLVTEPNEEATIWNDAVQEGYSFLFSADFNHETATDSELAEKFREKGLSGATIRKCMSCFAGACEAAGIKTSPHLKAGKRTGGGGRPAGRRVTKKKEKANSTDQQQSPANSATAPASSPAAIQAALLAKFPEFNPEWPAAQQAQWFESFQKFMAVAMPAGTQEKTS